MWAIRASSIGRGGRWRGDEASPRVHGDRRAGEKYAQRCSQAGGAVHAPSLEGSGTMARARCSVDGAGGPAGRQFGGPTYWAERAEWAGRAQSCRGAWGRRG